MKSISLYFWITFCLVLGVACSKSNSPSTNSSVDLGGELAQVKSERGLTDIDLQASLKTYVPSGKGDDYLAFIGTGVSGRIAVVGLPSMRILKYVSVFSSEPWQGFAFDDQSKSIVFNSSRDEIEYDFGDIGRPAVSLTDGKQDARSLFVSDAANGRIAVVDLLEYETKQIVTNPLFSNANPDVVVTENTEYAVQTTQLPDYFPGGADVSPVGGVTFWKFKERIVEDARHYFLESEESFTILLPESVATSPVAGRQNSNSNVFLLTNCSQDKSSKKCKQSKLYIVDWMQAQKNFSSAKKIKQHGVFEFEQAIAAKILKSVDLSFFADALALSQDGRHLALMDTANKIHVLNAESKEGRFTPVKTFDLKGTPVDARFSGSNLLVTTVDANQIVQIDLDKKEIRSTLELDYRPGAITVPLSDGIESGIGLAIVANHEPHKVAKRLGPNMGLGASLIEFGENLKILYETPVAMTSQFSGVAITKQINKPVFKYKIGTDPRTGEISYYKTNSGKERVVRNGKRVHVFATVIRSHITPDTIEVEQDDIVSIHITSQEQSKDQTHGFTIDTYNVHGSWEPGKTASVTFVANRPGVFPFYCTEFCSALHLEMQGYLLVKPKSETGSGQEDKLTNLRMNEGVNKFFNFIKGE